MRAAQVIGSNPDAETSLRKTEMYGYIEIFNCIYVYRNFSVYVHFVKLPLLILYYSSSREVDIKGYLMFVKFHC